MTVENILQRYNLKNTSCRKFILSELLQHCTAMTENELKNSFPGLFDRVTFYHTLKTLKEVGTIHKIVLQDSATKYAISRHSFHEQELHSHFHCHCCDEVFCLQNQVQLQCNLPQGFERKQVSIVIEGVCAADMAVTQ